MDNRPARRAAQLWPACRKHSCRGCTCSGEAGAGQELAPASINHSVASLHGRSSLCFGSRRPNCFRIVNGPDLAVYGNARILDCHTSVIRLRDNMSRNLDRTIIRIAVFVIRPCCRRSNEESEVSVDEQRKSGRGRPYRSGADGERHVGPACARRIGGARPADATGDFSPADGREPNGLSAGAIAEKIGCPHNTLSSHLSILARSGLIRGARDGRSIIYRADVDGIRALIGFLVTDCCQGHPELCGLQDAITEAGCCLCSGR